ncbi:nucleobase:cation symporter-2 family protein [uncultured Kocuria sp.]|uniref:nucleobase:cation symporter-2 family protein n=1 Tax=uncultured Kocuria sp. TaxID=259305 RepID=UPI002618F126|nr:nucleobase:cation symporter-2 family protein [uncultured Kocuria sp.]
MSSTTPDRPTDARAADARTTPARTSRRGRPAPAPGPEDERLPLGRTTAYGFQHVLTMYGAIVAVPLIIGQAAGLSGEEIALLISSCLLMGGVATVLQSFGAPFLGSRLPLVQGVSFAGVAPMLAILAGGNDLTTIFGAVLVSSVVGFLLAGAFSRVLRLFPPVVTGTVITVIGISLLPVAISWAAGAGDGGAADPRSLALAGITLLIVLVLSKVGVGMISRLSILLSFVLGTVIAHAMGMVDFSGVGEGGIVTFPTPLAFGPPTFEVASIISMLIVVLVTMTETTADILAVGEITGAKVDSKRVANGLRADMLSSAGAPLLNSFTQTAFAANVGLVAVTGVRSRFVVTAAGVIMVGLGLFPVIGEVVAAIPTPVLGGASIVLFGTVASSGVRTLAKVNFNNSMNLVIVAVAFAFGLIPVAAPQFYAGFPSWTQTILGSGISAAALVAIALNLLFNELTAGNSRHQSVMAAAPVRVVRADTLAHLREGDRIQDGAVVDSDGAEVAVVAEHHFDDVRKMIDDGEITHTGQIRTVLAAKDATA